MTVAQVIEFRNATLDDVRILQEIFDYKHNLDKLERYSDNRLIEEIKSSANLFLVACTDARIQCFIWIAGLNDPARGPKIEEFASRSPGSGYGSALFVHTMRLIIARGHERVWLAVAADNEKAIRFYARFGFVEKEVRKAVWSRRSGDIADGLLMEVAAADLKATGIGLDSV